MRLVYLKKSVKNRDKYGRTEIAIQKTIEECLESEILVDFIKEHKEEVDEIMRNMSQEKRIRKFIDFSREEGREEGRKEGMKEGIVSEALRTEDMIKNYGLPKEVEKDLLDRLKNK